MDYRFFPEPDLPPLVIEPGELEAVRAALPELPDARAARYRAAADLGADEAATLLQSRAFADFYDAVAEGSGQPKAAAHWMLGEVSRLLNQRGADLEGLGLQPGDLALLVRRVAEGVVAHGPAKEVLLPALIAGEGTVDDLIAAKGLAQVSDAGVLVQAIYRVLAAAPDEVARYREGKTQLLGWFIGLVMRETRGKGNPDLVRQALIERLG